jgi:putative spermidine/putrescine transport system permease protein
MGLGTYLACLRFDSIKAQITKIPRLMLRGWVVSAYIFLMAPFLVIMLFSLDPREFANFPPIGLSLKWYLNITPIYLRAFIISVLLGLVVSFLACLLGIMSGLSLVRGNIKGKEIIEGLFRAPLQVPTLITGVAFLQLYYMLARLMGVRLLETFTGLVIGHLVITFPFTVGTVVAILQRFPQSLEEAALTLGASPLSTLMRVTLPIIKPGIYAGAMLAFIMSFSNVTVSLFLVGPNMITLPVLIYSAMEFDYDPRLLPVCTLVVLFSALLIHLVRKITGMDIILQTRSRE